MRLALAGDTMLSRGVADQLARGGPQAVFAPEVADIVRDGDAFVLNLECCVSERGRPAPIPGKPFFFRAPPAAADTLATLGVTAVSLANNHSLDFGTEALTDTRAHLTAAGIADFGAGSDVTEARAPAVLNAGGVRVGLLGLTDHPPEFAAGPRRAGVAYADLSRGVPEWVTREVGALRQRVDVVLVSVHWGPNMVGRPVDHVRAAAPVLTQAGATLVAGHSAHVFHGFTRQVLFDLGDFIDDYAVHPSLRNDLGLLFLVTLDVPLDAPQPPDAVRTPAVRRVEAVPIALDWCRTRRATPAEYGWVRGRLTAACELLGTTVTDEGDRLVARWPDGGGGGGG